METFLFLLELAGTVAFAVSGAVLGIEKHMDIFGVGLLGITTAFALACAALCWTILNDSSNIMTKSDDIVLGDFSGMTQDEVNASEQVASGQVVVNWEEEYSNDYAAGYVYKQSPVAGRTVREGDRFGYDYALSTREATVRLSAEYRSDRLRADVALALGDAVVLRRGYYELEFLRLYDGEEPVAPNEVTERYVRQLEKDIVADPGMWLWSHRRWKHRRQECQS